MNRYVTKGSSRDASTSKYSSKGQLGKVIRKGFGIFLLNCGAGHFLVFGQFLRGKVSFFLPKNWPKFKQFL